MGYHKASIVKGVVGEISKIQEELDELRDAMDQEVKIMALVELSDMYGAMELFLEKHFPTTTMHDLRKLSDLTRKAFKDGSRV